MIESALGEGKTDKQFESKLNDGDFFYEQMKYFECDREGFSCVAIVRMMAID